MPIKLDLFQQHKKVYFKKIEENNMTYYTYSKLGYFAKGYCLNNIVK